MRLVISIVLSASFLQFCCCQNTDQRVARFMFWNVENAFDVIDDPLTLDEDFLPSGVMRWNTKRYNRKISDIYKTIMAAGGWTPPEIIAFCEVESKKVLEDIVYGTYLSRYDYGIIHEDSPDERGIDVCMIYLKSKVKIVTSSYRIPEGVSRSEFGSRSVLHASIELSNDTIHLFMNHWPSRRGGVLAGEELRTRISTMLKEITDSIFSRNAHSKIVIAGDFNCTPEDSEIRVLTNTSDSNFLFNLSEGRTGTYRYIGNWEMIDQVIVSKGFIKPVYGLLIKQNSLEIFKPEFLLMKDPKYPGVSPFSMYRGYRYQGGISDHLPVLLDLYMMPDQQE